GVVVRLVVDVVVVVVVRVAGRVVVGPHGFDLGRRQVDQVRRGGLGRGRGAVLGAAGARQRLLGLVVALLGALAGLGGAVEAVVLLVAALRLVECVFSVLDQALRVAHAARQ